MNLPQLEEKILKFWQKNKIFEKSLEKTKKGPKFIFYEGPPFANGLPGIHHLLSRALKDVILRYKTMRGFYVKRKAGWDTHGLPTEISAEKSLKIKSKKEIENNIGKFIEECKNNVFTYKKEWEEFTERIGFWLDLENAYITCSNDYIESLWWILKQIWEKGLLYQDYKVVPYCPRCGTSLSSHEVAQGYKTISEESIYVKFPVKGEKNTYFLVWTTTPWTLPGNVAIAINSKFIYVKVRIDNEYLILAKDRLNILGKEYEIIEEIKGKDLLGLKYEPLYKFTKPEKKAWFVISGAFVSLEDGTGLVHIAPAFGEEDMLVGKENDLPVLLNIDEEGNFETEVRNWAGMFVKDADPLIIKDLDERGLLFRSEIYTHEYPFCWRCDSPLLYYAKESWFIKTTAIRGKLIENNKKINWVPDYLKEGRFGEWLRGVKDWNLSRERYWGTPLPIWQCEKCHGKIFIGSIEELTKKAGGSLGIKNLHRPYIDKIILKCDCGEKMKRVPEVIDCWFDSGAMPFAQWHYPFENKNLIDNGEFFPADFICEGIDQTRGWFYTLLVVSILLGFGFSYKNVIANGIVLDAKGQKMSKSKGNVVNPLDVVGNYGADVARFYFYTVNPVAENKRFDFKDIQSLYRKFFDTLINSQKFFITYKEKNFNPRENFKSSSLLDKWIISYLENVNSRVVERLESYDIVGAARLLEGFVDNLSNWYIRRSRKRFQKPETEKEKERASQTLYYVLLKLIKLLAPFTPFISDSLYRDLGGKEESVHLESYPVVEKDLIDGKLEEKMEKTRKIVARALAERAAASIKVRQPLSKLKIKNEKLKINDELINLIKEEVNIKEIFFDSKIKKEVELDTRITPELREEGIIREIIRQIQELRKQAGLKPKDKISIQYFASEKLNKILVKQKNYILKETIARNLEIKPDPVPRMGKELDLDGQKLWLGIKKL